MNGHGRSYNTMTKDLGMR
jgi:hypothetical protein